MQECTVQIRLTAIKNNTQQGSNLTIDNEKDTQTIYTESGKNHSSLPT